ncbi:MAG: DinB family protein [Anaerolineales bacterium]
MDDDPKFGEWIAWLLEGGHAHMPLEAAVAEFPEEAINQKPPNVPYTPFALLEHLRRTQADILEYVTEADYEEKEWPEDYWPPQDYQASSQEWERTLREFQEDLEALADMARNPDVSLLQPLEHAPEHNLLRELLIVADHNSYHLGEFAILRQVMGTWGEG